MKKASRLSAFALLCTLGLVGWWWMDRGADASAGSPGLLQSLQSATEAAADSGGDAYMPGLFK